jgi:hypothetical protein
MLARDGIDFTRVYDKFRETHMGHANEPVHLGSGNVDTCRFAGSYSVKLASAALLGACISTDVPDHIEPWL